MLRLLVSEVVLVAVYIIWIEVGDMGICYLAAGSSLPSRQVFPLYIYICNHIVDLLVLLVDTDGLILSAVRWLAIALVLIYNFSLHFIVVFRGPLWLL